MGAVVGPNAPIVVGLAFGIFAVLVVQKRDDLVQHRPGNGKARAEHRPGKLQCEVGAYALIYDKILEASAGVRGRVVVKLDALVDAFLDCVAHSPREMGLGQTLAKFEIALIEKLVPRNRHPVDVAEPASD